MEYSSKKLIKWHGITGSWRYDDEPLKNDVERTVRKIIHDGDGIVTGGALGVDYIATQLVLNEGSPRDQLSIYLPVSLDRYIQHFYKKTHQKIPHSEKTVVTLKQVNALVDQLIFINEQFPECINSHWAHKEVNKASYYARIDMIAKASDDLHAFHVNGSEGVQFTIDSFNRLGKDLAEVNRYTSKNGKLLKV